MSRSEYDERIEPGAGSDWHSKPLEDVYAERETSEGGLVSSQARERLERYGPNEVEAEAGTSPLRILIEQYSSALIWVLIVAALVMAGVGHTIDAAVIAGIVVFITLFGFVQDYRAEQSIQALKEMSTTYALVRRDGEKREIDTTNVVPGDVLFVESGDAVPADARLIEESNLSVDEAALTGESVGVSKEVGTVEEDVALAERENMLFKDTVVERGSGMAVVVETGPESEIGQIATALGEAEDRETPFQAEMDRLGKIIAGVVIFAVAVIAIAELVVGETAPLQVFLTAVGIAVSAVPEGLPAVVTLSLALGARRMADQNALVRRLPIVEALGSVDVICTDKTGTLTEEEMTVQRISANREVYEVTGTGYDTDGEFLQDDESVGEERVADVLRCGMLCNNVDVGTRERDEDEAEATESGEQERTYLGDPTEIALFVAAQKADFDHEELTAAYPRLSEIEFTSARKRMTTVHETPDGDPVAYMKGAPETVLERCDRELVDGELVDLTDERREAIEAQNEDFAEDALRVMGFAYRPDVPDDQVDEPGEDLERNMVFLGLQGMLDPPRPEVTDALAASLDAGINVVMITGDNAVTARAVGEDVGLRSTTVITGPELEEMSDDELADVVEDVDIFARTSPDHKTRILQTLQAMGHTVAMTGDGVNDAPAVKNADVGVAMGIRGTDVTEQASDIVLLDDNFATIRDAVKGGRRIFDNVRKFVNYLLSGNGGEVTMVFTGSMLGFGLVITPIQILFINVVTDGIPALSMGVDPPAKDIMDRDPRPPDEGVITNRIVTSIVGIAIFMTVCLLPLFTLNFFGELIPGYDVMGALFGWSPGYEPGRELAQTMVFTGFVVFEIVRIQAIRYRYGLGLFTNRWLVIAVAVAVTLQLLVLYTPTGQFLFDVEPLAFVHWVQIGVAAVVFALLMAVFVKVQDRYFERY
ncbi:P-type transport ATPase (probable substrate calcium/metal cation) (plasmid) [Natrialba magadii ATCC 43099]|uniref:P-type HAD superfamily ATPase n=1 Tax=Natrialba magadii (strain ATCC 43099 / DSM 3394 / CCM 3739 / CIP 104546 / IAM 13178 / JCM 8861 / NBRC 102185 / NCIMB 2190 / MS3) TaxID=547559 RepID=D3T1A2_NATMM|nr:cation-transporting P-type ATPase [Natrialba magadii]ADD07361.1 P-type transport ATPase (probable substrate calcium/metal cation) [Natrialba magadii ATCC 43099]ELY32432.1 P-type HAD superfamily ATPase [Natrialba magadii ATCC 43099]